MTDGSETGTHMVADIDLGPYDTGVLIHDAVGRTLFFSADDGIHGWELWATDGTAVGTHLVADIVPGRGSSVNGRGAVAGNRFFFTANDGIHGSELWTSLGTSATTRMVKDIRPGSEGSAIQDLGASAAFGGWLFFTADDGVHGQELWMTNGSEAGTQLVADIQPGSAGSAPQFGHKPITATGTLFFFADDGVHGAEPWALPLPILTPRVYLPMVTR